jgi:restriction endonuclease S subunit
MKQIPNYDFSEVFSVIPDSNSKIKTSSYLREGEYAVVGQGKEIVAGYTNTEPTVDESLLPVVVFGDHTRTVKYIDFPFTAGADGTQILKPSPLFNPKYSFYTVLNSVDRIPSKGYARHFGDLRKMKFQVPSLDLQGKVVEKLDKAFLKIELLKNQNREMTTFINDVYWQEIEQIFHRNINDWPKTTIGESCDYKNGKAHEKLVDPSGRYRLVTSKFVSSEGEFARRVTESLTPLASGDVAFVLSDLPNGKALAKAFLVTDENDLTLNQRVLRLRSNNFHPKFLYFMINRNPYLRSFDNGESQTHLKLAQVLACPLLIPDLKTQAEVAKSMSELKLQIDSSVQLLAKKGYLLETLQKSILHESLCQSEASGQAS